MSPKEIYQREIQGLITQTKDLPLSHNLLQFYREKCESFEKERAELVDKVDGYALQHKKHHDLMWELRRREEEIKKLQDALRNAQTYVFKEREQCLDLQRENDTLRIQEVEDRKKIRDLLALTQPVQQEITYFKDARPESVTRLSLKAQSVTNRGNGPLDRHDPPSSNTSGKRNVSIKVPQITVSNHSQSRTGQGKDTIVLEDQGKSTKKHDEQAKHNNALPTSQKQPRSKSRVMRTVFLPNEKVDTLLLTVESLKASLEEQKHINKEREEQLLHEREVMMQEVEERTRTNRETINKLQSELSEREELLAKMTREFLVSRNNCSVKERTLTEETEKLRAENQQLRLQNQEMSQQFKREAKMVVLSAREQNDEFAKHFRDQTIERENQIVELQRELAAARNGFEVRVKHLEGKAQQMRNERDKIARRRNLEWEGYRNDIMLMKKDMRRLENRLYKSIAFHLPPKDGAEIAEFVHYNAEIEDELHMINKKLVQVEKEMKKSRIDNVMA